MKEVVPCLKFNCTNYAMEGDKYCQKCLYGDPIPMLPQDAERKKHEDKISLMRTIKSLK